MLPWAGRQPSRSFVSCRFQLADATGEYPLFPLALRRILQCCSVGTGAWALLSPVLDLNEP